MANEITAVVEGDDVNTFRQPRFQSLDLLLDRVNNVQCIRSVANYDHATDDLSASLVQHSPTKLRTEVNIGDVADVHRRTPASREHHVVEVIDGVDQTNSTHCLFCVVHLQNLSPDVGIATLHG